MYDDEKLDTIKKWLGTGSINIFGRQFSGKDSQGRRLAEIFYGNITSSGEILRGSTIPDYIKKYTEAGKLIPSDEFVNIILPYLMQSQLAGKPLFLSSFGRWHGEEDAVIKVLNTSNHPLKAVIYLDIKNEEVHKRWLARDINNDRQKRHDDTEEILNVRLNEFGEKTLPVLDYYRNLGLLIKIDGKGPRDEITSSIISALYKKAAPQIV